MEPMLTPGETRKVTRTDGWTVEVGSVAGGSFTQVVVRDTLGVRAWNRSFVFETAALQKFAELKAQ
jgi:hypothetical protein